VQGTVARQEPGHSTHHTQPVSRTLKVTPSTPTSAYAATKPPNTAIRLPRGTAMLDERCKRAVTSSSTAARAAAICPGKSASPLGACRSCSTAVKWAVAATSYELRDRD